MRRLDLPIARCLLITAALLSTASCRPREASPTNVILIVVDTLRAQNLSTYGYSRDTSPNLTHLAETSYLFEQARSTAPCTFPSANSILTGKHANRFFAPSNPGMGIPDSMTSLAERLKTIGYSTLAVSASPIVRTTPSQHNPTGGFGRGFDHFDESCLWQGAHCVNQRALEGLENLQEPYFSYLHYMDPHGPYQPPEGSSPTTWTKPSFSGRQFVREGKTAVAKERIYTDGLDSDLTDAELQHFIDLYDDEIRYFDRQLGLLVDQLEERDSFRNTLLIVAADHGEAFLEHGDLGHCRTLYDTVARIPLLLRRPGQTEGRRLADSVSNLSIVPTVLDALGLELPEDIDGVSLLPFLANAETALPPSFSAWTRIRSITQGRYKLIFDIKARNAQLFDVLADPEEQHDLAASHPDIARDLLGPLTRWYVNTEGSDDKNATESAEEVARILKALGYLQ